MYVLCYYVYDVYVYNKHTSTSYATYVCVWIWKLKRMLIFYIFKVMWY